MNWARRTRRCRNRWCWRCRSRRRPRAIAEGLHGVVADIDLDVFKRGETQSGHCSRRRCVFRRLGPHSRQSLLGPREVFGKSAAAPTLVGGVAVAIGKEAHGGGGIVEVNARP